RTAAVGIKFPEPSAGLALDRHQAAPVAADAEVDVVVRVVRHLMQAVAADAHLPDLHRVVLLNLTRKHETRSVVEPSKIIDDKKVLSDSLSNASVCHRNCRDVRARHKTALPLTGSEQYLISFRRPCSPHRKEVVISVFGRK